MPTRRFKVILRSSFDESEFDFELYVPFNTVKVISTWSVYLLTLFSWPGLVLCTTNNCLSWINCEDLPWVLGNKWIRPFISGEQKVKTEGNRGTKAILENREHRKSRFWGTRENVDFFRWTREQVPPPPPHPPPTHTPCEGLIKK